MDEITIEQSEEERGERREERGERREERGERREEILSCEISDEVLESAAATKDAAVYTMGRAAPAACSCGLCGIL
jgi:hypothetical protein